MFPPCDDKEYTAQDYLHEGGSWGCQTNMKQICPRLTADNPADRKANAERADDTLKHDEDGIACAVKVTDKAKQERCEQAVDGVCLQILCCCRNHGSVFGKEPRQQISTEERQVSHYRANNQG